MTTKVKICGITNKEDALLAAKYGADYLGVLVDVAISPRSKTIEEAKKIFASSPIPVVALVYQLPLEHLESLVGELSPFAVQFVVEVDCALTTKLKEKFPQLQIWQSLHLPAGEDFDTEAVIITANKYIQAGANVILLDTVVISGVEKQFGGTGQTSNWHLAAAIIPKLNVPVMLAGGVTPDNVTNAVKTVKPFGIDVSSGVEKSKGKKDAEKLKQLVREAKKCSF